MATLRELNITLSADVKPLEKEMRKASRILRKESRDWSSLAMNLSRSVTLPLLAFSGAAVKVAGDIGKFEDGLQSVMGSAEATQKELALLRKEAEKPGLDFEQAVKGSLRLQNVDFTAERARKTLSAFGNAVALAGGTATELDGVTLALTQIQSKGKVSAEEINQLAERVPQIRKAMQGAFGTADTEQLQKMKISTEKFIDGVVAELEKLPTATSGINNEIINTGVEFKMALASVGKEISEAIDLKGLLSNIRNFVRGASETFAGFSDSTKKIIVDLGLLAAAAGPAVKVAGVLRTSYMAANLAIMDIKKAGQVYKTWMEMSAAAAIEGGAATQIFTGKVQALKKAWQSLDFATKATAIGLVVAAAAAAIVVFSNLNSELSTTEKIQANLTDVNTKAAQSIAAEKVEAERLTGILKDENATREQKAAALKKLQSINSEYFGQLDTERSKTEDVNAALSAYIGNIEKRARLAAANERLIEIEKELLDTQQRLEDAKPTFLQMGVNAILNYGNATGMASANIKDLTKNLNENKKSLEAQKAALLKSINETPSSIATPVASGGGSNVAASTKEQSKAVAALREEYQIASIAQLEFSVASMAVTEQLNLSTTTIDTMTSSLMGMEEMIMRVQDAGGVMAASIGDALNAAWGVVERGESSFKKIGQAALAAGAKEIRAAIMVGVANAVKNALSSVPFPFNLAAGAAAGIAAGGLFNKALGGLKIPALAEGAVVDRPTLALIGERGPEIVAPPQKLPGLATMMGMERRGSGSGFVAETRIKRGDLYLIVKEAARDEQRKTGKNFFG